MPGGSIKVIEGCGYAADGPTRFNAMATVSWDARAGRYGFRWETPAGPGARIEYVAAVRDGTWHEIGTWVAEGQPRRQIIEMRLTRIGDTDWPAGGAVDPAR